jgi:hypothetical protein
MKLLFVEIVRWLLRRDDPRVAGVRFLLYGAAEQGRLGLLHWKRRLLLRPFVFADRPPTVGIASGGASR